MSRALGPEDVLAARADVLAAGERFADAAGPILEAAIRGRLEAVTAGQAGDLSPAARAALLEAAGRAVRAGVDVTLRRLGDPDVWLSPRVRLDEGGEARQRSSAFGRRRRAAPVGELASPENRVWIAILGAAKAADPVLEEFGLRPSPAPDPGGGHFGLQPRTLTELDPSGLLASLWRAYRDALTRYGELLRAAVPDP